MCIKKIKKIFKNNFSKEVKECKGKNREKSIVKEINEENRETPIVKKLNEENREASITKEVNMGSKEKSKLIVKTTLPEEEIQKRKEKYLKKRKNDEKLMKEKKELFRISKEKWQLFQEKETFLTYREKEKMLERIKKVGKIHFLKCFFSKTLRKIKRELSELKEQINNYNDIFITKRLEEYSSFFDGKDDNLKYPLDDEQRLAVIKDDMHNLVVAGAGSGKTSVITTRIAYLIRRKDKVEKEKILALAFTRVAAEEMQDRLKKDYNIEINISTFHALGYKILTEETGKKPNLLFNGNDAKYYDLIKDLFKESLKKKAFQDLFINYLAFHIENDMDEESFKDKKLYYRYMQNKKYVTFNNIEVKSISERNIANFFFMYDIKFEYEPLADWADHSDEKKDYHPDFYLPEFDIYIEHWGVNEKMEVPEWFSISSEEYMRSREWKLAQFQKNGKKLIETWDYERINDELIPNLKENLKKLLPDIKFTPISYDELVEKTYSFKQNKNQIINQISNFIKIAKSNFLEENDISERLKTNKYTKKQKIFGRMALKIYAEYQKYLEMNEKIDFNDMINKAVKFVKNNPKKYLNSYDHVLIDEFQDISYQRLELIQAFVNENSNTKLFCVGDDWQSIYQFTGSDVRFFINFNEYFPNPQITHLVKNYRCTGLIVKMSNDLIANNKKQIKKQIRSTNTLGQKALLFELPSDFGFSYKKQIPESYNLIRILLSKGIKPDKIMVLSRFNNLVKDVEIKCGAENIP
ncbi:MAG: UvrD-helicase domain-containing protein, partial [Candidatus Helarchaeota archaeon]